MTNKQKKQDKLADEGYFLKTGILVKRDKKVRNGFLIQQVSDVEPEQVDILEAPG